MDNGFILTTIGEHKIIWNPTKGRHRLTAQDSEGNMKTIVFFVD
ncbi:MAG: hypothetical protein ACK5QP_12410 [Chitinophagales bacterium]